MLVNGSILVYRSKHVATTAIPHAETPYQEFLNCFPLNLFKLHSRALHVPGPATNPFTRPGLSPSGV